MRLTPDRSIADPPPRPAARAFTKPTPPRSLHHGTGIFQPGDDANGGRDGIESVIAPPMPAHVRREGRLPVARAPDSTDLPIASAPDAVPEEPRRTPSFFPPVARPPEVPLRTAEPIAKRPADPSAIDLTQPDKRYHLVSVARIAKVGKAVIYDVKDRRKHTMQVRDTLDRFRLTEIDIPGLSVTLTGPDGETVKLHKDSH